MIRLTAAAVALALSAGVAVAGEAPTALEMAQHIFAKADADKDGVLTPSEHDAAGLGRFGVTFSDFDADDDSRVTWDEYRTLFERHHQGMNGRAA